MRRYLEMLIREDLNKKMVFVGGPRQVGKTTMAKALLAQTASGIYLNWDDPEQRRIIFGRQWNDSDKLIVLDELHKLRQWKNFIKGTYDTQHERHQFLITGSARLDVFRRGGDSLMGRYHYWRLHPFCLSELPPGVSPQDGFNRLMTVGGFPEPFLENDLRQARRWRRERYERVLRDDLRDLESIQNISAVTLLVDLLRNRVGSEIVVANLARDLEVSPHSIKKWLEALERMYLVFTVRPYTGKIARAVKKSPKIYFFDNADVDGDEGSRLENLVANSLIKRMHFYEDRDGYRYDLMYLRDRENHEVDFVIVKDRKVIELIEVKLSFKEISRNLKYFGERLSVSQLTQICADVSKPFTRQGVSVASPLHYFSKMQAHSGSFPQ